MKKTILLLTGLTLVSLSSAFADECRDPRTCGDRRIVTRDDVRRDRQPEPPRRPDYRPEPPRRPDYHPEPPRRPDYRPEPPRRPDYHPEPPRRPDYRPGPPMRPLPPHARRGDDDFGRFGHRPDWRYRDNVDHYRPYRHQPVRYSSAPVRRYQGPVYYQRTLPWRFVYWNTWLRVRVDIGNGFSWVDNYPFFIYNGYSHRYSNDETCNYQLVDGYENSVSRDFSSYSCNTGYDMCADLRDNLNSRESTDRFFCSEKVESDMYSQNNWDYQDDFYSDVNRY